MKRICRLVVVLSLLSSNAAMAQTYTIDPAATSIRILVYRAGLLKGLGHNHIVSISNIGGTVVLGSTPDESIVQLSFPVTSLVVDNVELRSEEGAEFSAEISQKDKDGTRKNMLGRKLLNAVNFPDIYIASSGASGQWSDMKINAEVTIRGQSQYTSFPVSLELNGNEIVASGELVVTHADLGLKPFKAALGTLRVRDELLLRYRIVAVKTE